MVNRLGLALNGDEDRWVVIPLQPHLDEGPEDDLEAHRELERGRRLPRQHTRSVQDSCGRMRRTFVLFVSTLSPYRPNLGADTCT
jgi:hypothetical protein